MTATVLACQICLHDNGGNWTWHIVESSVTALTFQGQESSCGRLSTVRRATSGGVGSGWTGTKTVGHMRLLQLFPHLTLELAQCPLMRLPLFCVNYTIWVILEGTGKLPEKDPSRSEDRMSRVINKLALKHALKFVLKNFFFLNDIWSQFRYVCFGF